MLSYMGDTSYEIRPLHSVGRKVSGRIGLAKLVPRVVRPDLYSVLRQSCFWLAIRSGTSAARVCTLVQRQHVQQQQQ